MALDLTQNNPFSPLVRSHQQVMEIFDLILPEKIPEIAGVKNDPYYQGLNLIAFLFENIHYYTDRYFRESFLSTCLLFQSGVKHADAKKFRIRGRIPSKTTLEFFLDAPAPEDIVIPKNTVCLDGNETPFLTVQQIIITKDSYSAQGKAKQYTEFVQEELISVTDGTRNQKFLLPDGISDEDIALRIGNDLYLQRENFYPATGIDKIFVAKINAQRKMEITLGDGLNGFLPEPGQNIFVDYYLTEGSEGNVPAGKITSIESQINLPDGVQLNVTNPERSTQGLDIPTLDEIKRLASQVHLKHGPAVNQASYEKVLEQYPGVIRSGLVYEFGAEISIYVVMEDGLPATASVLSDINKFLKAGKQIMLIDSKVKAAGSVKAVMDLAFDIAPNAYNADTLQNGLDALIKFFNVTNQEVGGTLSTFDIQKTLAEIPDIKRVIINKLSLIPYARPTGNNGSLNWFVEMKSGATIVLEWRISFVSQNSFLVYKGNSFEGTYQINTMVIFEEVSFEIKEPYDPGSEWKFKVYPYLGNQSGEYSLEEPSIFILDTSPEYVKITGTGGLE